jgi:hypothetical protein
MITGFCTCSDNGACQAYALPSALSYPRTQWTLAPACYPCPRVRAYSRCWCPHVVHALPFVPAFSTRSRAACGSRPNNLAFPLTSMPILACAQSCFHLRPHYLRGPPPQTTHCHILQQQEKITAVK